MNKVEATNALEYAANHIDSDSRRGVFIKAFVEGEEWAWNDFHKWCHPLTVVDPNPQSETDTDADPVESGRFIPPTKGMGKIHPGNETVGGTIAHVDHGKSSLTAAVMTGT